MRQWQEKREGCRYVFNLVNENLGLDDEEALYKAHNNATKCINQSLAVVGEQIGLPFNLSMHVARHTFAVFALNKRMLGENEFFTGIFIGGMKGVEDEYEMFTQLHPKAKVLPMASIGAAAKIICDKYFDGNEPQLCVNLAYSSLVKDLLNI